MTRARLTAGVRDQSVNARSATSIAARVSSVVAKRTLDSADPVAGLKTSFVFVPAPSTFYPQ